MTDEMRAGVDFGSGMIMAGPGALYARPAGLCAGFVGAGIVARRGGRAWPDPQRQSGQWEPHTKLVY